MIRRILFLVVLSLAGAWLVRTYLCEAVVIATGSMEPTLQPGTHFLVNKCAYRFHPPLRGDIVMLKSPIDPEKGLIKRVIAVGGDEIEMRSKQVFLNGSRLDEPYAVYKRPNDRLMGDNMEPLKVPPGSVFVLGDDRDESEDSSVWKDPKTGERVRFVPLDNVQGRLMKP